MGQGQRARTALRQKSLERSEALIGSFAEEHALARHGPGRRAEVLQRPAAARLLEQGRAPAARHPQGGRLVRPGKIAELHAHPSCCSYSPRTAASTTASSSTELPTSARSVSRSHSQPENTTIVSGFAMTSENCRSS